MTKVIFKEIVTKERQIEVSIDSLIAVINTLDAADKKKLIGALSGSIGRDKSEKLLLFQKDNIKKIIADFAEADLYEDKFLLDLETGLEKSSVYK